jgi:hypothetical protein
MLRDEIEKQNQENDKKKIAIKRLRTKSYIKIQ